MNDVTAELDAASKRPSRCPACGQPLDRLERGRCPLCDYMIEEEPVTGQDQTPYARTDGFGRAAWWHMCRWMWTAGSGRLTHMSLMQSSRASRRFGRVNVLLLSATVALCWFWLSGWHSVRLIPGTEDPAGTSPSGYGWVRLAEASVSTARFGDTPGRILAWWWNPLQAAVGAGSAFLASLMAGFALLAILRRGVERSLLPRYRGQRRLGAALEYSTAWGVPLVVSGVVLLVVPLCRLAEVAEWPIAPAEAFVYIPAGVVAGLALSMWWFGLIRLAATCPVRTRGRMILFCALWMPLMAAAVAAGYQIGLMHFVPMVSPWIHTQW